MSSGCFGAFCFGGSQPTLANLNRNFQAFNALNRMSIKRNGGAGKYTEFENALARAINSANGPLSEVRASRNLASRYRALKELARRARNARNSGRYH